MELAYMIKIITFVISILLLTSVTYSLYQITVDLNNCDNILIEISTSYNPDINKKNDSILYYACFFYKNNSSEDCYSVYESDLFVITSIGIKKISYKPFILSDIPEKVVIKNYQNITICESLVNSCAKDGICNEFCGYDEDCSLERTIVDLEKTSKNLKIELEKLPTSLKIAIIALLIVISILIWKFLK